MKLIAAAAMLFLASGSQNPNADDTLLGGTIGAGIGTGFAQVVGELTRPGTDTNAADGYTPDGDRVADGIGTGGAAETRPAAPPRDVCSPENPVDCSFTGAEPTPPPAGEPAVTLRASPRSIPHRTSTPPNPRDGPSSTSPPMRSPTRRR